MKELRTHQRFAFIGVNGTGKSTQVAKLFKNYNLKQQHILIVAETTPKAYHGITRLKSYEELARFRKGIALFYDYENSPFEMLAKIREIYSKGMFGYPKLDTGGALVLEDCTNYLDVNIDRTVKPFIINHRMYDIDLLLTTHQLAILPLFVRRFLNGIILFKTGDIFSSFKDIEKLKYMNAPKIFEVYNACAWHYARGKKHYSDLILTGI